MPVINLRLGANHSPTQSSLWKLWMLSQQAEKLLADAAGRLAWLILIVSIWDLCGDCLLILSNHFYFKRSSTNAKQDANLCKPWNTVCLSSTKAPTGPTVSCNFSDLHTLKGAKVVPKMHKIDRTLLQTETLGHPFISSTASIWNCIWNVV